MALTSSYNGNHKNKVDKLLNIKKEFYSTLGFYNMSTMENVNKSTHISKLHDVLLEIFGYLLENNKFWKVISDFLNATLVCKKWNRIIAESPRLMDKVTLSVDLATVAEDIIHGDFKLSRPYRHVTIEASHPPDDHLLQKLYDEIFALVNLTTLDLSTIQVSLTLIGALSKVKSLRILTVGHCSYFYIPENLHDSLQFKFDGLRELRLMGQTEVLQHMRCKALDLLAIEPGDSCRTSASEVIGFLNDLNRCDEINIGFFFHRGTIPLNPKFTWNTLKLCYSTINQRSDMSEMQFIEALCNASTTMSESDIDLRYMDDRHHMMWRAVIGNCKNIKSLRIVNSSIPLDLSQIREVPELRKLAVDQYTFEHENFSNLLQTKLTGVSHPEIID